MALPVLAKAQAELNPQDTISILAMIEQADNTFPVSLDQALLINESAYQKSVAIQYQNGIAWCLTQKGYMLSRGLSKHEEALALFTQALQINACTPVKMKTKREIGRIFARRGLYEEAMLYSQEVLRYSIGKNDADAAKYKSDIALCYWKIGNFPKAKRLLLESTDYFSHRNSPYDILRTSINYQNLAELYTLINDDDSARIFIHKVDSIESLQGNHHLTTSTNLTLADIHLRAGNRDSTLYHLQIARHITAEENSASIFNALASFYIGHRPDSAMYYNNKALGLADREPDDHYNALKIRSHLFQSLNKPDSAIAYLSKAESFQDSILNVRRKALSDILLRTSQQEDQLFSLTRLQARSRQHLYWLLSGIVALLLLSFALYRLLRRSKKEVEEKRLQLQTAALELMEKTRLVEEAQRKIELQEAKPNDDETFRKYNQILQSNIITEEDWNNFRTLFEEIYPDFFSRLRYLHPSLTRADMRLLAVLKMNLSMKEAARILAISPDSVKKAKYRLKKKLGMEQEESLEDFLQQV
ncbi:tetratricopeptide repeat protein [Ohtaekwangia sp.]|uniref:tetratricopeptide repeat protein n=1 Tax=Ohtaekwangia sp. TaxID=2066019 RepID=UPI002F926E11